MNVLEKTTDKKNQISELIKKMNTKTIRELRSIAKDQGLRGYYKLKKADLIALLSALLLYCFDKLYSDAAAQLKKYSDLIFCKKIYGKYLCLIKNFLK